jgi:hypothetical protein
VRSRLPQDETIPHIEFLRQEMLMDDYRQNIDPIQVIVCQALKNVADRLFLAICSGRNRIAGVA